MKLSELLESPEIRDQTINQAKWVSMDDYGNPGRFLSIETVDRKYDIIDHFTLPTDTTKPFIVGLTKTKTMAGVFYKTHNTDGVPVMAICSLLYVKQPIITQPPVDMSGAIIQVDRVATVSQYEDTGIATRMYAAIVKQGYILVSDSIQYRGGMKLWKKVARQALPGGYLVHVFDTQTNDYLKDSDGAILTYNGSNLPDTAIWLTGKPGQRYLLIAKT